MKRLLVAFLLLSMNICLAQQFEIWSERSGKFTIGVPSTIVIYVKNLGTSADTYNISFTKSASYRGSDASGLLSFILVSGKIYNVQPGETKSTKGELIILGPISNGKITFTVKNNLGQQKTFELAEIRADYPQTLSEFNKIYLILILFVPLFIIKSRYLKLFNIFGIALLILPLTRAGYISMTTYYNFPIAYNQSLNGVITVENSGDEIAKDVLTIIESSNFYSENLFFGDLGPNQIQEKNSTIIFVGSTKEGKYLGALKTYYKDSNGYLFSAIAPIEIIYKSPSISKINIETKNVKLEEKGNAKIEASLTNFDYKDRIVNITLYLPDEIYAKKKIFTIDLPAQSKKTISIDVSTVNAIKGSNYVYFLSAEYEDLYHYSSYSLNFIEITEKNKVKITYVLAVLVLLLSFLFFVLTKKPKKK